MTKFKNSWAIAGAGAARVFAVGVAIVFGGIHGDMRATAQGAELGTDPGFGTDETVVVSGLELVEFRESFAADTVGNGIVFKVKNTTAFPVTGLSLRPMMPAQYLTLDGVVPPVLDLDPGQSAEITVSFSVREDAEVGAQDIVDFYFEAVSRDPFPIPSYRLIALIEEAEEDEDESTGAQCNSAVDSGGDEGGGVTVDLGGFVGKAGFSWQMHDIKDQMDVTVGGIQKTTGCVSGTGTFQFDIPAGAATATVVVVPNCEGTSGTQWDFTFECPLSSQVTTDGSGADITGNQTGSSGSAAQDSFATTALGAPVTPAPAAPTWQGPTGNTVSETADNNALPTATSIGVGDRVQATIETRSDKDLYAVNFSHQGELMVDFQSVPAGINITFRVLTAAGAQIRSWQTAPATGVPFSAWVDIKTPGDYVIEVRDGSSNALSADQYSMVTSFTPTADPAEPNDQLSEATPLGWNQAMASNILPLADKDHFSVEADRQGQLMLNFTKSPANLNMSFRVLTAAGAQVKSWQTAPSAGQSFMAFADLDSPGTYIIEVRDGSSNARSATPYEMVASLNQTRDPAEPNNSFVTASPATIGTPIRASILPLGDTDHYSIDVAHQGQFTVEFTKTPVELNMTFRVLDGAGAQVKSWQTAPTTGLPFAAWVDLPSAGRYVVEVRDGSSNARSPDPYEMVFLFVPTKDTGEPNNAAAQATPVVIGSLVEANILPIGDKDHYVIDAHHQGQLTVDFASMPQDLNMAFRILDGAGSQVRGWQTAPTTGLPFSAWADLPAAGRYIIEVRDGSSNARSVDAYQMAFGFDPTADVGEPNNAVSQASPIAIGASVTASILPLGDKDHYIFSAPAGELTVAILQSPDNLNLAFRILDAAGSQVKGWKSAPTAGGLFSGNATLPAAGQYVIEMRDGSSNARSPDAYIFSLSMN